MENILFVLESLFPFVFFGDAGSKITKKHTEFIAYHTKTKLPGGLVKLSFECHPNVALRQEHWYY